jgi:hypothetical protein
MTNAADNDRRLAQDDVTTRAGTHAGDDVGDVDDPLIRRRHSSKMPELTAADSTSRTSAHVVFDHGDDFFTARRLVWLFSSGPRSGSHQAGRGRSRSATSWR